MLTILTPHTGKVEGKAANLVRLGPMRDGGYLVAENLLSESYTDSDITIGVGEGSGDNIGFELDLAQKLPLLPIDLFDHTLSYDPILPQPTPTTAGMKFHQLGLGAESKGPLLTLSDIFQRCQSPRKALLKIDVEGAEWESLDDLDRVAPAISQLVIELHWLDKEEE